MSEEWNDGYYLEGMDRIHVATCGIEDHILEHPSVIKAGGSEKIALAIRLLSEVYQEIGKIEHENIIIP